jgi:hypothetical protein
VEKWRKTFPYRGKTGPFFPYCGKNFSIAWKNGEKLFHSVEKWHETFPHRGKH